MLAYMCETYFMKGSILLIHGHLFHGIQCVHAVDDSWQKNEDSGTGEKVRAFTSRKLYIFLPNEGASNKISGREMRQAFSLGNKWSSTYEKL